MLRGLLRFVTVVPYAYGALAKLNYDWLWRYEPATRWCDREIRAAAPWWLKKWLVSSPPSTCGLMVSVGGISIDAAITLLWVWPACPRRRWHMRLGAMVLAAGFHLANYCCFHLGIFPVLMLSALVLWVYVLWV